MEEIDESLRIDEKAERKQLTKFEDSLSLLSKKFRESPFVIQLQEGVCSLLKTQWELQREDLFKNIHLSVHQRAKSQSGGLDAKEETAFEKQELPQPSLNELHPETEKMPRSLTFGNIKALEQTLSNQWQEESCLIELDEDKAPRQRTFEKKQFFEYLVL